MKPTLAAHTGAPWVPLLLCCIALPAFRLWAGGWGELGPNERKYPLHWAAFTGNTGGLERSAHIPLSTRDNCGLAAIHWACMGNQLPAVKWFVSSEADLEVRTGHHGYSPLLLAAQRGDIAIVRELLSAKVQVDSRSSTGGLTPLHEAAKHKQVIVVQALLSSYANVEARTDDCATPLFFAAMGNPPFVDIEQDRAGARICQLLVAKGAGVDTRDRQGIVPIHLAVDSSSREVVRALLQAGARVDIPDEEGRLPIHLASRAGTYGTDDYRFPIELGMEMAEKEEMAIREARLDIVKQLIAAKSPLSVSDEHGMTALLYALGWGHSDIVNVLLANGADPNASDRAGFSALHFVAWTGDIALARSLLSSGALPTEDRSGTTPAACALQRGHKALHKLLSQSHPAKSQDGPR